MCTTLLALALSPGAVNAARDGFPLPAWFVPQALCVHSGWHWSSARPFRRARPEYRLAGRWWFRTSDVPDAIAGGSGEGSWGDASSTYGGGLQFMLGTWNRAALLSHGLLPVVGSTAGIAQQSPAAQMYAAFLIVQQDRWSWGEWPQTSRACGLG